MGYGNFVYRRPSGIYVFRLIVPAARRHWFDRNEVHISTGERSRLAGTSVALRWRMAWDQVMSEQAAIDASVADAPWTTLAGDGLVQLGDVSAFFRLDIGSMAWELGNAGTKFYAYADGWPALHVPVPVCQLWSEDGVIPYFEVEDRGEPCHLRGMVQLEDAQGIGVRVKRGAASIEPYMVIDEALGTCFVARPNPPTIPVAELLVEKTAVTQWKRGLVTAQHDQPAGSPGVSEGRTFSRSTEPVEVVATSGPDRSASRRVPPTPVLPRLVDAPVREERGAPSQPAPVPSVRGAARFAQMRLSTLIDKFVESMSSGGKGRVAKWKPEELARNRGKLQVFCDLTGDPTMEDLQTMPESEELVERFLERAILLPTGPKLTKARAATGGTDTWQLIAWADEQGVTDRMSLGTARNSYLTKASECLTWGQQKGYLTANPCAVVLAQVKLDPQMFQSRRRVPFTAEELQQIFSAEWFKLGRAGRTSSGGARAHFRPYQYWLPLMGLYVGGRVNELSQLYLDDVRTTGDGVPYISFALDRPDKIDGDEGGDETEPLDEGTKSFKTANSIRAVPIHDELVRLGLLDYVEALRKAGHDRLFPELRFDKNKGYGATPRKWFNERFLGRQLSMTRDGTKVFHSLRHNFQVAARHANLELRQRQQLMGHQRGGNSTTESVYDHDDELGRLRPGVNRLAYALPVIAPFDKRSAVAAVTYTNGMRQNLVRKRTGKQRT